MNHLVLGLLCCLAMMTGCGTAPATIPPPVDTDRLELVDIGGRRLELRTRGQGSPTVIIETGMGVPGAGDVAWRAVIEEVSKSNRVCIYSRAGLGRSDPAPELPRTSLEVASDLQELLSKAGVSGPYLLVGHSYGGIHIRTFADEYPEDVLGMVLVDATHPDQNEQWIAALPSPTPDEPESVQRARGFLLSRMDPTANPEQIDTKVSGALVREASHLGGKPVVILSHSSKFRLDPSLPEQVSLEVEEVSQRLQNEFKKISSNSTLDQSVSGGHYLHAEDPDLVIRGIRHALHSVEALAQ